MPELMVTEDHGLYCGGGLNASLDLSLYLVERFCGHEVAMQSAKAMLIEMPRAWQAGFAIVPLKTEHSDESISDAQEWLHRNFQKTFPLEEPAERVGMRLRNFVRRFKEGRRQPLDLPPKAPRIRSQAIARKRPSHHAGDQRRSRLPGCSLFPQDIRAAHRCLPQRIPP
jgi:hypothetical protein